MKWILLVLLIGCGLLVFRQKQKIDDLRASLEEARQKIATLESDQRTPARGFVPSPTALDRKPPAEPRPTQETNRQPGWMWNQKEAKSSLEKRP